MNSQTSLAPETSAFTLWRFASQRGIGGLALGAITLIVTAASAQPANELLRYAEVEFTITPRAIAEPCLDQRIFPDAFERVEGNAAPIILRMAWEQPNEFWSKMNDARKYLEQPIHELSAAEVRKEVPLPPMIDLQRAAYRTSVDWQYPLHEGQLGVVLLPDVQGFRKVATALAARCRADIAEHRIADALEKITIGLGIADHLGKSPFFVVKIVQAVVHAGYILDRIDELVQDPDAPNLYWALTMLPEPLINVRAAVDFERRVFVSSVPELRQLDEPRTEEQWSDLWQKFIEALAWFSDQARAKQLDEAGGPEAVLKQLAARGREELSTLQPNLAGRIESMGEIEVALRYFDIAYRRTYDRTLAAVVVPPSFGLDYFQKVLQRNDNAVIQFPGLEPVNWSPTNIYIVVWKTQRRIAALRVVEGLRDYAARHEGRFPMQLADVTDVPLPPDPCTGRPFDYELKDGVAIVTGEPMGIDAKPRAGLRYRIRVR